MTRSREQSDVTLVSSLVECEASTKTSAPSLCRDDLPALQAESERVRARLEFLLTNYFRRNEDGSYRLKPLVRYEEREALVREVRDLQQTGQVIEELIEKVKAQP